jgi:hypothetical protein
MLSSPRNPLFPRKRKKNQLLLRSLFSWPLRRKRRYRRAWKMEQLEEARQQGE